MSEEKPSAGERPGPHAHLGEQAAYFDAHPEDIAPENLNNLYLWLPGSRWREQIIPFLKGDKRRFMDDFDAALGNLPEVEEHLRSIAEENRRMEQDAEGIGEEMERITAEIRNLPDDERGARFRAEVEPLYRKQAALAERARQGQRANEALIPLYRALRERGYSHLDIVS